jgi:hypothetical protein
MMKENCLTVPVKVLALPEEGGASTEPVVGDEVEITVTGKVASLENGNAYVEIATANGEPVVAKAAAAPADDDEPTEESLRKEAEAADQNMI